MISNVKYFHNAWFLFFLIIVLLDLPRLINTTLQNVDDDSLMRLIRNNENVVVFFTKDKCEQCDELEMVVKNVKNEMKENIGAVVVVKAHNSNMIHLYDPSKEPALVYFRHGIPLLYYGDFNEESIVNRFLENREPCVKELTDENFEHLTQAATGATTGDWFVFFYSADCVACSRLFAVWEAVGAALKHRVNVARIDRIKSGSFTAKRFNIIQSLEFIFLRQGKFYRYRNKDYSTKKLIEFAEKDYMKETRPETIPQEVTLMSSMFNDQLEWLAKNQQFILFGVVIASIILLGIKRCCTRKQSQQAKDHTKKAK